jgi:hypothetical protein
MTARKWLAANGYADIVALIDEIMLEWRAAGKKTRRNWWETLAGAKLGRPRTVAGRRFPVLASAQRHEGLPVTPNALQRSADELPPPKIYLGKWSRRQYDAR